MGPPPPPPPPPPRTRLFGPGDLRLVILALIAEQPRHGYEIIKAIEERLHGAYAPSPGAVYPVLTFLSDQDLIQEDAESQGGKRRYSITPAGRAHVEENQLIIEGIYTRMGIAAQRRPPQPPPEQVMQAMHTLRHALGSLHNQWSPEEAVRVSKALLKAAREVAGL